MLTTVTAATTYILTISLVISTTLCDEIKDINVIQEFNQDSFLAIDFDGSFYNALFIENKTDHQRLKILDFQNMRTREYRIDMMSKFVFAGPLNTGNIVVGCEKHAYFISKIDGYSMIEMPMVSTFFKDNRITNKTFFNNFNQTLLIVYNLNKLAEIDSRLPLEAKSNFIRFGTTEAFSNIEILDAEYISGGTKFAVLYKRGEIEGVSVYNQKTNERITSFGNQVDDTVRLTYNVETNNLVLVKHSTKSMLIYDCSTLTSIGTINFSLTGLKADKIDNIYSPLGTKLVLITSANMLYIFCLESRKFLKEFTFPVNTQKVYWAEGTEYFVAGKIPADGKVQFEVFRLLSSDSKLCHKSCGTTCNSVFKPCYNQWMIVLSMALGFVGMGVILSIFYVLLVKFVPSEESQEIVDDEGNLYELTEEGSVRAKRNTITLDDNQLTLPDIPN